MQPQQPGYNSSRVYLELLADLPWDKASEEHELYLKAAESVVLNPSAYMQIQKNPTDPLMFLGQDLSSNVQQHHFDIDRLISNHVSSYLICFEYIFC